MGSTKRQGEVVRGFCILAEGIVDFEFFQLELIAQSFDFRSVGEAHGFVKVVRPRTVLCQEGSCPPGANELAHVRVTGRRVGSSGTMCSGEAGHTGKTLCHRKAAFKGACIQVIHMLFTGPKATL